MTNTDIANVTLTADSPSLWRDRFRGKHHIAPDQQETLCGRYVHGFWETEPRPGAWASDDLCKSCAGKATT